MEDPKASDRCRGWRSGYWPLAVVVVGLGIMAYAWQLLVLGLTLLVLGPFRDRRLVFWPLIAAVVAFELASFATLTLCGESTLRRVTDNEVAESTYTVCDQGSQTWKSLAVPIVTAVATGSGVWLVLRE